MNSVRPKNLSLKYQSWRLWSCKDIGNKKFEYVANTQFLYNKFESSFTVFNIAFSHLFLNCLRKFLSECIHIYLIKTIKFIDMSIKTAIIFVNREEEGKSNVGAHETINFSNKSLYYCYYHFQL